MKVARSTEKSLDRVTDFYLEAGADGLTILGMMGEAPKMTQAESTEIARRVIARAGKVPVVVGVSAPVLPRSANCPVPSCILAQQVSRLLRRAPCGRIGKSSLIFSRWQI